MDVKLTGSFYTPENLIEYMVSFIEKKQKPSRILEPSAGDGRFVKALQIFDSSITLIEYDQKKVLELRKKYKNKCNIHQADFNRYAYKNKEKYDLIIGNPPYISKKNMDSKMRQSSEKIIESFNLSKDLFQNIWVAFILSSIKLLDKYGCIFFVLPFEFLQVQYAEKLRIFLEKKFNVIEITTFEKKIFDAIEQDVCLVYLANVRQQEAYIQYRTLKNIESRVEIFSSIIKRNKPLKKWSNCILNDEETEKLFSISNKFKKVEEFGEISPGIVTGANNYFILSNKDYLANRINKKCRLSIIARSKDVKDCLLFKLEDYKELLHSTSKIVMINTNGLKDDYFSKGLKAYIMEGEEKGINKRYKCSIRKRWYDVPIIQKGNVCFFKRYSFLPRIVVNRADIYTTDVAYNIRFYNDYQPESFAFCFYNSLTLALCEYEGRFYGGGVGELVPTEFKLLVIPYKIIEEEKINKLDKMFRDKSEVSAIIDYVDSIVLTDVSEEELQLLQNIRKRYLYRRLRKE